MRLLLIASTCVAMLCGLLSAADAVPRERSVAAVHRGLDWLKGSQQTNGVWSDARFPALTALPLWAFARGGRTQDQPVIDAAVAALLRFCRPDGGIYAEVPGQKGGGLATYNTAIAMTALHATGRKDLVPVIQKAREFMAGSQHLGDDEYRGGFGYDRATGRAYTDLSNTQFALGAMRATQDVEDLRPTGERRVDVDWEAALNYVTRLQNQPENSDPANAGGFTYNPNDPKAGIATNAQGKVFLRSFGSMTYAGLLSLVYAQVARNDPRVTSAVAYAGRHWTTEENPGMGQQGLFYYLNVMARALATAGLDTVPREDGSAIAWRDEIAAKVIAMQQPDGSWTNPNNRFWEGDPALATSFAVLTLQSVMR